MWDLSGHLQCIFVPDERLSHKPLIQRDIKFRERTIEACLGQYSIISNQSMLTIEVDC
jgi:hypothetical protein